MDEQALELAAEREEAMRQLAIDNRVQYQGESAEECEHCGVDIPQARRVAVPGCQRCVDCQQQLEGRR